MDFENEGIVFTFDELVAYADANVLDKISTPEENPESSLNKPI